MRKTSDKAGRASCRLIRDGRVLVVAGGRLKRPTADPLARHRKRRIARLGREATS